jgi:hypothetical protein
MLSRLWEALSPDPCLGPYEKDYKWLTQVYESVKPPSGNGKLLWHALGAKTVELVHENVLLETVRHDLDTLVMDAEVKNGKTPMVVERIVTDIDEIVRLVRFPGWQNTKAGEREVQKALRKVIYVKYQVKDQDLFDKAFGYIRQYY